MPLRPRAALAALLLLSPTAAAPLVAPAALLAQAAPRQAAFTIEQVRSYPFPTELAAAGTGSRLAWAMEERGRRNLYVAEGPQFAARRLTNYTRDDGQELTSVTLSPDGAWVVYVRGGEHGSNWDDRVPVNPAGMPTPPKLQLWAVRFAGGEPVLLAEDADEPAVSPKGDRVAFTRGGQLWTVPIDGSAQAQRLLTVRGSVSDAAWSPDGSRLAFVSGRGDHAFVGIYANDSTPVTWLAPSTSRDGSPRWSPDGRRLAFVRRPGSGGAPAPILEQRPQPWAVWIGDASTGEARRLWEAPATLRGSPPGTHGGTNLHWAAGDRIVFATELDGWAHLYSMPAAGGGQPLLLTPGNYMVEHVRLTPDRRHLLFSANAGSDAGDIDRRHVVRVPVDQARPEVLTPGAGIETFPVPTGDGRTIAMISATAQRPPLPAVLPAAGGAARLLAEDRIPADFPTAQLVTPRQVTFRAPDGLTIHAQLFERAGGAARKPAIVFVHGGPPRQMLLGWHYGDYYANTYAMNQYLASQGYVVLAVNYRLGIGYGREFQRARQAGAQGASEYQDVKAAGEWLRAQPQVDGRRIGVYGGSYGGYLTALALARDSDLFAAGVDIHGVHDFTSDGGRRLGMGTWRYEPTDRDSAAAIAWRSSPVSAIDTWKSPVLFIHGDDDRNVRFAETVDLVQRLRAAGVPFEELIIPDDTHHWMLHANAIRVNRATAEFFGRTLMGREVRAEQR